MHHPKITLNHFFEYFQSHCQGRWINPSPPGDCRYLFQEKNKLNINYFNTTRYSWVNLIGQAELKTFIKELSFKQLAKENDQNIFIFTEKSLDVLADTHHSIKNLTCAIFDTFLDAKSCMDRLYPFLEKCLAPRLSLHGTFISVLGKGVLLRGVSGIGKSSAAMYCLKQHHKLVADDAPEFYVYGNQIIGNCPDQLANLLEIRHLGILDINKTYGAHSVQLSHQLDLIVDLYLPNDSKYQLRPPEIQFRDTQLFGYNLPTLDLPFQENIAFLIENAVRYLYTYNI